MSDFTELAVEIADGLDFTGKIQVGTNVLRNIVVATIAELEKRWELSDQHILLVDDDQAIMQHPITERPNLLTCDLLAYTEFLPDRPGKYVVWLGLVDGGGVELFAKPYPPKDGDRP